MKGLQTTTEHVLGFHLGQQQLRQRPDDTGLLALSIFARKRVRVERGRWIHVVVKGMLFIRTLRSRGFSLIQHASSGHGTSESPSAKEISERSLLTWST